MKLWEIIGELHTIFNPKVAENWDNVGLLVGDNTKEVNKVLFCLDVTEKVVKQAVDNNVDLIISHHPVIFSGLKKITNETVHGRKLLKLIENKIAVYSIHTNSDFAINGLNDFIMDKLNLDGEKIIFNEHEFEDYNPIKNKVERVHSGLARIKILNEEMRLEDLLERIKNSLGISYVRYVGNKDAYVRKIGLVTGGGSSFLDDVADKIDVFLTGDLRYHEALDALEDGKILVDVGHFESEYLFVDMMEKEMSKFFDGEMIRHFEDEVFKLG
ncbi:Nif3-like dinuclear metal center hexameric protein [Leptotrichia hongkongensis]|uniref:Nif3-like dinuclear metal center hexameric protein n=1 Tax=Leptotrichia hongkongensis TaxID=554406 RepID=A0ABV4S3G5_9FUSO|nr:Nif3-like dinuclear metal center hexameric protein [Leptotrichia hongkongensis]